MIGMRDYADGGLRLEAGPVAKLYLSRPEVRNAITHAMWDGIHEVAQHVSQDRAIRVLIIAGEGVEAFSAGADIAEFPKTYASSETAKSYNASVRRAQASIAQLPIPVLAEIRGACFGGGCGLALHGDIRFAAKSARFAIPPAKLGLAYSFEDTKRLVSLVGPSRAKDMLMSGRTLGAGEAYEIGLVDHLVEDLDLLNTVQAYADRLASLSSQSIEVTKQSIVEMMDGRLAASDRLHAAIEATFSGDDFAEGYKAFLEKRKPDFS